MRALIDPSAFIDPGAWQLELVNLFRFALDGRHSVVPDPFDAPEFEAWLKQRDAGIQDECRFAVESSLDLEKRRSHELEIRITSTKAPRWGDPIELTLKEALRFLDQPLAVILEGGRTDRDFLLAVADRHQRKALEEGLERRWFRVDHGGGLEEMAEQLREKVSIPGALLRTFWIFDSDALAPELPSPASQKLRRLCQRKLSYGQSHQLARRTAENYLPIPAIREIWTQEKDRKARRGKSRAFEKLDAPQRHHFNMKSGLGGDRKRIDAYQAKKSTREIARRAEQLYGNLDRETRKVLDVGFGGKVRDLFKHPHVRTEDSWFEADGLRVETRPVIERLLSFR